MKRAGFRLLSFLLLNAFWLGGCTLLHPHRITNPNLPPGFKEQRRAARKAQKNSLRAADNEAKERRKKAQNPDADGGTDAAPPPGGAAPTAAAAAPDGQTARVGADKSTVKFDKHGLMKKPKLKHRRYYKPLPKPFRPWQSIRNLFKKKPRRHGKSTSAPKAPAAPSPTPAPADTGLTP